MVHVGLAREREREREREKERGLLLITKYERERGRNPEAAVDCCLCESRAVFACTNVTKLFSYSLSVTN